MLKKGATFTIHGRQIQVLVIVIQGPTPRMIILFGRDGVVDTMLAIDRPTPSFKGEAIEALT